MKMLEKILLNPKAPSTTLEFIRISKREGWGLRETRKDIIIILPIIESVARKKSVTDLPFSYEGILLFSSLWQLSIHLPIGTVKRYAVWMWEGSKELEQTILYSSYFFPNLCCLGIEILRV